MMNNAVSVVICTHNGRSRLEATLQYLVRTARNSCLTTELVVVDNHSTDDTTEFCTTYLNANSSGVPWRVVQEPNPGLSHARKAGMDNTMHPFLVFVDDDNWLGENFLMIALQVMHQNTRIGILGGKGIPVFEGVKPAWFERHARSYALGEQAKENGQVSNGAHIYGAGMVVRRSFLTQLYSAGFESQLLDRRGNELSSGGDNEWCLWCSRLGYDLYYDSRLQFHHFIPTARLRPDYLIKRAAAKGQVEAVFRIYDSVLKGKGTPQFLRKHLLWNWELIKRGLWWLLYRISAINMERRMSLAFLAATIQFRFKNRRRLQAVGEYIENLNKKFP